MPAISFIIPVYKAEKTLKRCADSILAQSYRNLELILVDDGSPDKSGAVCDEYAARDSRVRVIHKENGGVSSARNAGLAAAEGEWISFVDSDDFLDSDFLENGIEKITSADADIFISGLTMEGPGETKQQFRSVDGNFSVRDFLSGLEKDYPQMVICGPWCKIFRREIIQKQNLRFDENLCRGEDTLFNLSYMRHCEKVASTDKIYYHYIRDNAESLFSGFSRDNIAVHRKVYGLMREVFHEKGCDTEVFEALYVDLMIGCIHHVFRFWNETTASERRETIHEAADDMFVQKTGRGLGKGALQRLIYFFVRRRWLKAIELIFKMRYRIFAK